MDKKINIIMIAIWSILGAVLLGLLIFFMMHGRFFDFHQWHAPQKVVAEKTVKAADIGSLDLDVKSADIKLCRTSGDDIKVTARGPERQNFSIEKTSRTLNIMQRSNYTMFFGNFGNSDVLVEIPDSYNGDLDLRDFSGEVECDGTKFGNAVIRQTSGNTEIRTLKAGSFQLSKTSGDAEISALDTKGYSISQTSGDVHITGITGAGTIKSTSGDVSVGYGNVTGNSQISTMSGDVDIQIPSGKSLRVSADTRTGDINTGFPIKYDSVGRNTGTVTVGQAPYEDIEASVVSGDISISQR